MDDFLGGDRTHKDDLIGADFDLPTSRILGGDFRREINKCVAHVTTEPIQGHDLWPVYENAHPRFLEVLDSLGRKYGGDTSSQLELRLTKEFIVKQFVIMREEVTT